MGSKPEAIWISMRYRGVVPWLEWAYELGLDIYAPQKGAFRAFKSHVSWHDIPKGGRYLISLRNPKDALVSFYHFFDGFEFEAGSISITEFAREFYMADQPLGRYWQHLASWWERRHDQNVLLLCFEEIENGFTWNGAGHCPLFRYRAG